MWWQQAKEHGVFFSEGGYDESAGIYAICRGTLYKVDCHQVILRGF